jgi:hypothetical protein
MEESFRLLVKSDEIRIGTRSVGSEKGIEVLVRLVLPGHAFDPGQARDMLRRLEVMIALGYNPTVHEGWWVVCERNLP